MPGPCDLVYNPRPWLGSSAAEQATHNRPVDSSILSPATSTHHPLGHPARAGFRYDFGPSLDTSVTVPGAYWWQQRRDRFPGCPGPRRYTRPTVGPSRPLDHPEALRLNAKFLRNGIVMLVLVAGTVALLYTWVTSSAPATQDGYFKFLNDVKAGHVYTVEFAAAK